MCMASKGTGACAWAQTSCIWGRLALGSYQGTHCMHARKHSTGLAWCMPLGVHRYFLPARTSSFRTGACTQRPSGRGMHGPARRIAACFARMWCVGGMFSYSCFCMIPRDHANMAPLQHVCAHIFPLQVHIASCPARFWVFFCGSPAGGGVSGTSPRGGPSWSTSGRSPLSQRGAPAEDTEGREVEACALALEGCAFRSKLRHVYNSTIRELWSCTHVSPRTCCCSCMHACEWPRGFYRAHVGAYGGVGSLATPGGAEASCVTRTPLGYAAGRAIGGRLSGGVRTGIFSVHTDRPKRAGAGAGVVVWKLRVPPGARTMRSATLSLPAGARRTPKAAGHLGQPSVGVRLSPGEPGAQSADCF